MASSFHGNHHHHHDTIPILTCALLAALSTGGPTYAFGIYGGSLKTSLSLTQSQLDTLSSANFCAGLLTWIPGILVDRYGVRRTMAGGGICGALGMLAYWAVARQLFVVLSGRSSWIIPVLCGCGICVSLANGLVIGAIYKIIVCTCDPHTKGSAVGVAKGYVGLGSGVYACFFQAIQAGIHRHQSQHQQQEHGPSSSSWTTCDLDFLPMAAILAIVACTIPAWILLPTHDQMMELWSRRSSSSQSSSSSQVDQRHFGILYGGLLALAVMVVGTSLGELGSSPLRTPSHNTTSNGWWLLVLWWGPILALLVLPATKEEEEEETISNKNPISNSITTTNNDLEENQPSCAKNKCVVLGEHSALLWKSRDDLPDSFYSQRTDPTAILVYDDDDDDDTEDDGDGNDVSSQYYYSEDQTSLLPQEKQRQPPKANIIIKMNYTLLELVQTGRAWYLLWIGMVLVGSGTMMTNNMGQMVESLSLVETTVTPASMALFSVAQATSRIVTGAMSDYYHGALSSSSLSSSLSSSVSSPSSWSWRTTTRTTITTTSIPRPAFLILASLVGIIAHIVLAVTQEGQEELFLMGVALSGAAFGMIWPLMVLLVGEIFGTAHMATNYLFYDGFTSAIGTLLLSKFVTQTVYEGHIIHTTTTSDDEQHSLRLSDTTMTTTCIGTGCFAMSHWVVVGLALSCVVAGYQLLRQTREIYAKTY